MSLTTPEHTGRIASNIPFGEHRIRLDSKGLPMLIGGTWVETSDGLIIEREVFDNSVAQSEGYAGKLRQVYMLAQDLDSTGDL